MGPDPNFGNQCSEQHGKFQIIEVPLGAPERAPVIRDVKLGPADGSPVANSRHDIGVLMNGHRRLVVCAGEVATVHDISSPARPKFVTSFTTQGGDQLAFGRAQLGRQGDRHGLGAGRRRGAPMRGR